MEQGWAVEEHQREDGAEMDKCRGIAEHKSYSHLGCVVRRALAKFTVQNPGGVFVSGCLKHDFLMFLGCFRSSV